MPSNPKISSAAAFAMTLSALALLAPVSRPVAAEEINRIVLRINDRIATLHDYESRRSQLLAELLQQEMPAAERNQLVEELGERVYRDLYEETILLSRADQLEIEISEDYLEAVLDQIQQSMGVSDRQEFIEGLRQSGLTFEDFRNHWRTQLRARQVISQEVEQPIEDDLEEEDLRRYYRAHPGEFRIPEQLHLREVVVLDSSDQTPAERTELAELIRDRLANGESPEDVVQPYAVRDLTSKVIDLGWIKEGELATNLEEAVFDLPAGTVSEPVPGRGGLHVVQVVERKESTLRPFKEVDEQIRRRERARLSEERYPDYLVELEEGSFIRLNPPPDAAGFRSVRSTLVDDLSELSENPQEEGEEEQEETEDVPAAEPPPGG